MLLHIAAAGLALAASGPAGPRHVLVTNVRLSAEPGAKPASILVTDGRIVEVAEGTIHGPVAARRIDGKSALALPAFVDAYSFTGCTTPEPKSERDRAAKTSTDVDVDMRAANRKGIQPAFRAADVFDAGDALSAWRESGFGALLSAPTGQLLAGQSALVVTREAAARDAIVRPSVFDHASFRSTGSGYPGTLMGSIAQLRQFFLDARRQGDLLARRSAGKVGERAPFDTDLQAAQDALAKRRAVCCAVDEADDVERFLALADEHGFDLAIAGGREAWKRAKQLAERKVPVILVLGGGDEPEDPDAKDAKKKAKAPRADDAPWTYVEPVEAKREKRRLWTEERDGARVLAAAGVRIAFGTAKEKPKDLLERVRKLVEAGLPRDVALHALTDGAADVVGAPGLGRIAAGADATFALWTKDPLTSKDAVVTWLVVDGQPQEFRQKKEDAEKPSDGVDASGKWTIAFDDPQVPAGELEIKMEKDGAVEGTLRGKSPSGVPVEAQMTGTVRGKTLKVSGTLEVEDMRMLIELDGELDDDAWKGKLTGVLPTSVGFDATRAPKGGGR